MRELRDALAQIRDIRQRMLGSQIYRGYRAVPTALSALFALCAALLQERLVAPGDVRAYVALWGTCALASIAVTGVSMAWHCLESASPLTRARTRQAVARLGAPLLAGALVTAILYRSDAAWALPGLWQVFFALGLFASAALLPPAILAVAAFYLASGCFALSLGPRAMSAATMGIPFFVGQSSAAMILHACREKNRGEA
jgi:hypothetical protein